MNQPSDNFMAETLIKVLGAQFGGAGSTAAGARVISEELGELDIAPRIVDGSGLSRSDRTSPRDVVTLLGELRRRRGLHRLARRRGAQRDDRDADARHRGAGPLPGQDGHAARRLRAGRLLHDGRRRARSRSRSS